MTGLELLDQLKQKNLLRDILYRHPDIHLIIDAPEFASIEQDEDEQREKVIASKLGSAWDMETLHQVAKDAGFVLSYLTVSEYRRQYRQPVERSVGWAGELIRRFRPNSDGQQLSLVLPLPSQQAPLSVLHFYGYKGGQARSTVMGMLAKALADDGWRVLVIDTDLEAPSLDLLFGCRAERRASTLLGVGRGELPEPLSAYRPLRHAGRGGGLGRVDLLACRPADPRFDLEGLAFAMHCAADPLILENVVASVANWAAAPEAAPSATPRYHALLIDHRAGLSPFVLPCMHRLAGPVVVFTRLDSQWNAAESHLPALLRVNPELPGLFISFQPDNENIEDYRQRNNRQIKQLLEHMADALENRRQQEMTSLANNDASSVVDNSDGLQPDELQDLLLVWPYDPEFRAKRLPDIQQTHLACREMITQMRSALEMQTVYEFVPPEHATDEARTLHPSGGADGGSFIQTAYLTQSLSSKSTIRFIFGRKGTGKTRLFRKFAEDRLGVSLLADSTQNSSLGGLRAEDATMRRAVDMFSTANRSEGIWWLLFLCGIEAGSFDTATMQKWMDNELRSIQADNVYIQRLLQAVDQTTRNFIFLLDAIEVLLPAECQSDFVVGLFRVLATLRSDARISKVVDFRLFLRADLIEEVAIQNIEQQTAGQKIILQWDLQSIWNFALLRIFEMDTQFYRTKFPLVIKEIQKNLEYIRTCEFQPALCENLFSQIFPPSTSDNIKITTFLKTYFSDNVQKTATYYPRVFAHFLEHIANPGASTGVARFNSESTKLINGEERVNPTLVSWAHQTAATKYLEDVRQELESTLKKGSIPTAGKPPKTIVDALLKSLSGKSSPFKYSSMIARMESETELPKDEIERAMAQMRAIGIFELVPDVKSAWRVGRLFKTALKMKFSRGPNANKWKDDEDSDLKLDSSN